MPLRGKIWSMGFEYFLVFSSQTCCFMDNLWPRVVLGQSIIETITYKNTLKIGILVNHDFLGYFSFDGTSINKDVLWTRTMLSQETPRNRAHPKPLKNKDAHKI